MFKLSSLFSHCIQYENLNVFESDFTAASSEITQSCNFFL